MFRRFHRLLEISLFWLALSMLFDDLNTMLLPRQLIGIANEGNKATDLGLLTSLRLLAGMLVHPFREQIVTRHGLIACARDLSARARG